jgi:hypothetical protein
MFTIAISYTLIKGYSFECGCFEIMGKETKTGILLIIKKFNSFIFKFNHF